MPTVSHTAVARTSVHDAFEYVSDYRTVPNWFFGITRFVPKGELDHGLGAVYDSAVKVGPKTLDSVVKVTEFEQDELVTLTSIEGFSTNSRWEFAPTDDGQTRLSVDFTYDLPGGIAGKMLGKLLEPFAVQAVKYIDTTLRRQLEQG
ncbi:SRPBCC family protein [Tsukamurella sp. 8F]|uniref:SRPBCC family protein n=1 Tax=unclassified Tsukamurella TaxID=2633480 RepID=UPI0023B8C9F5|nr:MULTISPECIES: SRPBCC family protein [unclassified Tsukamurella]MDF0530000.1 SRPBCC family protein [Tsukamurella sp. 8J]MDF0587228.1 SRPBCC family protein [Tsukamurella sp. 8F]